MKRIRWNYQFPDDVRRIVAELACPCYDLALTCDCCLLCCGHGPGSHLAIDLM